MRARHRIGRPPGVVLARSVGWVGMVGAVGVLSGAGVVTAQQTTPADLGPMFVLAGETVLETTSRSNNRFSLDQSPPTRVPPSASSMPVVDDVPEMNAPSPDTGADEPGQTATAEAPGATAVPEPGQPAEPQPPSPAPPGTAPPASPPPPAPGTRPTSWGSYRPSASTTGVPDGTQLTRHNGDLIITTPGQVIDSMDIHGFVIVKAPNVVIRNSIVRGSGPGDFNTGLVTCYDSRCTNLLIEDSTLVPEHPSVWISGVFGHDFTARRLDVYNVVDGFNVHNVSNGGGPLNVAIQGSSVHDLSYFSSDPNHGGGSTHNDCIQIQGGSGIVIEGNNLVALMSRSAGNQNYPSRSQGSGIMVSPSVGPVTGANVSANWIDGGEASVRVSRGSYSSMSFGLLTNNRFGHNQFDFGGGSKYVIRVTTGVTFSNSLTTNRWFEGGALAVGRNGGIRYDP